MFLFRWLRNILVLIGLGTVIWWGIKFLDKDHPIRQKVESFAGSEVVQEGVKDIKTLGGEVYREIGGKKVDNKSEITENEKERLDDILAKELREYKVGKDKEAKKGK